MKILKSLIRVLNYAVIALLLLVVSIEAPFVHKKYIRNIAEESTVQIYGAKGTGSGSHVTFKNKTVILTNKHVCELADSSGFIEVERVDKIRVKRKVIKRDEKHDLCIIEGIKGVKGISIAKDAEIGETFYTLGHPRGDKLTVADGEYIGEEIIQLASPVVNGLCNGRLEKVQVWFFEIELCVQDFESVQFSTPTYPGNSGSPIVNKYGNLVAVVFAGNPQIENMGFGVPLRFVKRFLSESI